MEGTMRIRRLLGQCLRLVVAGGVYLVCFVVSYGLLMPAIPPDPAPAASPIPPGVALLVVAGLNTAVMGWLILRSHQAGWALVGVQVLLFYGVQTFLPQLESVVFQAFPGYASNLPLGIVPRILAAGLLHAGLWIPIAVLVLGRWRNGGPPARPSPRAMPPREWAGKLSLAAGAYVVLYFTFGYYVAWRMPAITAYYHGTDPGSFWLQMRNVMRDTPWLPPAQALRGLLWTALAVTVLRTMLGALAEKALAVGALFAVVMNAGLLLPNPFMPVEVRMIHLVETASSNFVFGVLVAWMFGVAAPVGHRLPATSPAGARP